MIKNEPKFRVVVARINPQHSYYLAAALQKAGMLEAYFTGLYTGWQFVPFCYLNWLPSKCKRYIELNIFNNMKRHHHDIDPKRIKPIFTWANILMAILHQIGVRNPWSLPYFKDVLKKFELVSLQYSERHANALVLYDTVAYHAFVKSKDSHLVKILDLATIPWQVRERLYQEEFQMWPGYTERKLKSDNNQIKRYSEELMLADYILVGSKFVKAFLIECGIPSEKIYVAYYGCDIKQFHPAVKSNPSKRLTMLYVGSQGLAKGFHKLLQILEAVNDIPIDIICCGLKTVDFHINHKSDEHVFHFLGLVPHSKMPNIMHMADMLCHPSLFDSFSLTCLEAMASGLPVLTTTSNGISEIITHGKDGFSVSPNDIRSMIKIVRCLYNHPEYRLKIGEEARITAEKYSWVNYEERIAEIFLDIKRQ